MDGTLEDLISAWRQLYANSLRSSSQATGSGTSELVTRSLSWQRLREPIQQEIVQLSEKFGDQFAECVGAIVLQLAEIARRRSEQARS
jgi:hypothetical protein